jgi:hypothetical protein
MCGDTGPLRTCQLRTEHARRAAFGEVFGAGADNDLGAIRLVKLNCGIGPASGRRRPQGARGDMLSERGFICHGQPPFRLISPLYNPNVVFSE